MLNTLTKSEKEQVVSALIQIRDGCDVLIHLCNGITKDEENQDIQNEKIIERIRRHHHS